MIDIHTHILPNVDDGSSSFDMSCEMLRLELENNVDKVILTPHYFNNGIDKVDKDFLKKQFLEFKEKVKILNIELIFGAELYFNDQLMQEINRHECITLGDSKYILLEFSLTQKFYDIADIITEIRYLGYRPILAHPERYIYLDVDEIMEIKQAGALLQINTTSINGVFGKHVQKKAFKLLKNDLVDFVASDCHDEKIRKPNLLETLEFIKNKLKKTITNDIDL